MEPEASLRPDTKAQAYTLLKLWRSFCTFSPRVELQSACRGEVVISGSQLVGTRPPSVSRRILPVRML